MRYAPLALAVLLGGCAQTIWEKPGATAADLSREGYECEKDARQSGYFGGGVVGALNMQAFAERCMVAHGWTPRRVQP